MTIQLMEALRRLALRRGLEDPGAIVARKQAIKDRPRLYWSNPER